MERTGGAVMKPGVEKTLTSGRFYLRLSSFLGRRYILAQLEERFPECLGRAAISDVDTEIAKTVGDDLWPFSVGIVQPRQWPGPSPPVLRQGRQATCQAVAPVGLVWWGLLAHQCCVAVSVTSCRSGRLELKPSTTPVIRVNQGQIRSVGRVWER